MARSTGTAAITFGLISISVKLYTAAESSSKLSFRQIDPATMAPVKQKLVNENGAEVERGSTLKGYELDDGGFVILTEQDIESASVEATKAIDIQEFMRLGAIDPVYFADQTYYLVPEKAGPQSKPYWLIHRALTELGLCALAQYAVRGKQNIVMIRADATGLIMQQLLYADEVRTWDALGALKPVAVSDGEVELAKQLVLTRQSDRFDPTKYTDTVKAALMGIIEAKKAGQEVTHKPASEASAPQAVDLMELLKKSVEAARRGQ